MQKITKPIMCIFLGLAFGLVTGCANTGIKHVSPERFITEVETMEPVNSASGTFYIGTSPTRAYVERTGLYKLFRLHKAIVYWTELEGLPPEIRRQMKENQMPWTPWEEKHLFILSGQSNMSKLNPDISFTPTLEAEFGKDSVIVVKDSMSAQPIRRWYKDWRSSEGDHPKETGDLYDRLMTKVYAATKGNKIKTVTFVWMQGECDAKEEHGTVYAMSLKGLVRQLMADLKRDDVNVVIGRINDFSMNNKSHPHWTKVREAQVEVAESLTRCNWVDTDDLNGSQNGIHATNEGYKTLGERFANKAIELIKK